MLEGLKQTVCRANCDIIKSHLVTLTWGNVSGFDNQKKLIVIKPSGVSYEELKPECMVVVDLKGSIVEGDLKPSSDTLIHIELYKVFNGIGSVVHTHSDYASMFAQARKEIPCLGTTHADRFYGSVPVTRPLRQDEVERSYEKNTGSVIVETFKKRDPLACPAVLVSGHGPFAWGKTPDEAVETSIALEKIAKMAWGTLALTSKEKVLPDYILKKHFLRKHGPNAYYGQKGGKEDD
ncbi:MAG: L-ribulose-5-phosphate 4-epimerase AraD [Candidatus Aminicenantes bacterium]|nr:L-ribulose-5-phosphate 4-epimerase AraD [Candidatus Aminicenantes bacterium]HHF51347.1 L-ribulose-5-phosphate 4-epimerase AraD [Candidatus Aminicenantes bacterium]